MSPRKPFRGRLPGVSRTVGGSSPAVGAANQNRTLDDIEREALRGSDHSDLNVKGESVGGTVNEQTVAVTFRKANTPQFVSHDLGYAVHNWSVVSKNKFGDVCEVAGSKYRPTKYGVWLCASVDGLKTRIRVDGQEGSK